MIDKSIMKKLLLTFLSIAAAYCSLYAQRAVTQERMEQIYEEVRHNLRLSRFAVKLLMNKVSP